MACSGTPAPSAASSAASSTRSPRPTLTSTEPDFIAAKKPASAMFRVCGFSGVASTTTSAAGSSAFTSPSAPIRSANGSGAPLRRTPTMLAPKRLGALERPPGRSRRSRSPASSCRRSRGTAAGSSAARPARRGARRDAGSGRARSASTYSAMHSAWPWPVVSTAPLSTSWAQIGWSTPAAPVCTQVRRSDFSSPLITIRCAAPPIASAENQPAVGLCCVGIEALAAAGDRRRRGRPPAAPAGRGSARSRPRCA